jgi:hypothetical protein
MSTTSSFVSLVISTAFFGYILGCVHRFFQASLAASVAFAAASLKLVTMLAVRRQPQPYSVTETYSRRTIRFTKVDRIFGASTLSSFAKQNGSAVS